MLPRLLKLRQLSNRQNLEDTLDEAAAATARNTRVWAVFGHLGTGIPNLNVKSTPYLLIKAMVEIIFHFTATDGRKLVVLSADSHVVR